jgi:hypothetical protein
MYQTVEKKQISLLTGQKRSRIVVSASKAAGMFDLVAYVDGGSLATLALLVLAW